MHEKKIFFKLDRVGKAHYIDNSVTKKKHIYYYYIYFKIKIIALFFIITFIFK